MLSIGSTNIAPPPIRSGIATAIRGSEETSFSPILPGRENSGDSTAIIGEIAPVQPIIRRPNSQLNGQTTIAAQEQPSPELYPSSELPRSPELQETQPLEEPGRPGELSEAEKQQVQELKARDREVRAHEQAHKAAGGQFAGAIQLEFTTGPDGRRYAVGGEVPIDASAESDPEATVRKMDVVIRAALAPAEPSPQDRSVARQAQQTKLQAQAELNQQRAEERSNQTENSSEEENNSAAVTPTNIAAQENGISNSAQPTNGQQSGINGIIAADVTGRFEQIQGLIGQI